MQMPMVEHNLPTAKHSGIKTVSFVHVDYEHYILQGYWCIQ